ncbi:MAG: acylphosphatase [Bdellovibrionales bacterium]|nr:acylphosphatase [Bdellovibrionales bacterium]
MTYHFLVSGRVQGVGFRAFTLKEAKKQGLKGWVRNLEDGRVEALVEIGREDQEKFLEILRKGPVFSRVDDIRCIPVHPKEKFQDFVIIQNSEVTWKEL